MKLKRQKVVTQAMAPIILTDKVGKVGMKGRLDITKELIAIAHYYEAETQGVFSRAQRMHEENEKKSVEGAVRNDKGSMVETMTRRLLTLACAELGISENRIGFKKLVEIAINDPHYFSTVPEEIRMAVRMAWEEAVRQKRQGTKSDADILFEIDGKLVLFLECKSYTDATMLRSILGTFSVVKAYYPDAPVGIVQLENAVGGMLPGYEHGDDIYFSGTFHSYSSKMLGEMPTVITLLDRMRDSKRPIHKPGYYKPINFDRLMGGYKTLKGMVEGRLGALVQRNVYVHHTIGK